MRKLLIFFPLCKRGYLSQNPRLNRINIEISRSGYNNRFKNFLNILESCSRTDIESLLRDDINFEADPGITRDK